MTILAGSVDSVLPLGGAVVGGVRDPLFVAFNQQHHLSKRNIMCLVRNGTASERNYEIHTPSIITSANYL